jgi:hypothetical protein
MRALGKPLPPFYTARTDAELAEARDMLWARLGSELFAIDPRTGDAALVPFGTRVRSASDDFSFVAFGSDLIVRVEQGAPTSIRLVRADGSDEVLRSFATFQSQVLRSFGEFAYLSIGDELIRTDGTTTGTTTIAPGVILPDLAVPYDGRMWFNLSGHTLEATDGTSLLQISLGPLSVSTLTVVDDVLVGTSGLGQLFATDGTAVSVVVPPVQLQSGLPVTAVSGRILFRTFPDLELWAATTTGAGTSFGALLSGRPTIDRHAGQPRARLPRRRRDHRRPVRALAHRRHARRHDVRPELRRHPQTSSRATASSTSDADDGSGNGYQPFVLRPEVFNLPVGQSCSGHPTGTHTLRTDVDPRVGRNVQLIGRSRFAGNGTGQVAGIFLGTASDVVTPLAMSRCEFRLDFSRPIAAITLPVDPAGNFQVGLQIPNLPALAGLELTLQAAIAPSPSPIGIDLTNGLHWVVGG